MGVINISGISDSRVAPVIADLIKEEKGPSLVVTPTYIGARRLASDVSFFAKKRIYIVPEDDNVFRGYEAKNQDTLFGFLEALRAVIEGEDCIVVAPVGMAIKKLPPKERFLCKRRKIAVGDELRLKALLQDLVDMGYERVPLVYGKGQFSMRGDILDIFTPYDDLPVRIDLFDNEVESMKTFDPVSQRSVGKTEVLSLYPAALIVREPDVMESAQKKIERAYKGLPERRDELLESIATGTNRQQLETYMDYFYEDASNLAGDRKSVV